MIKENGFGKLIKVIALSTKTDESDEAQIIQENQQKSTLLKNLKISSHQRLCMKMVWLWSFTVSGSTMQMRCVHTVEEFGDFLILAYHFICICYGQNNVMGCNYSVFKDYYVSLMQFL